MNYISKFKNEFNKMTYMKSNLNLNSSKSKNYQNKKKSNFNTFTIIQLNILLTNFFEKLCIAQEVYCNNSNNNSNPTNTDTKPLPLPTITISNVQKIINCLHQIHNSYQFSIPLYQK